MEPARRRALDWMLPCAAALVALAVHWPVLDAQALSLDDDLFLARNEHVLRPSLEGAWRVLSEVAEPSVVPGYYAPLGTLSLMLESRLGGEPGDLRVFHATSLALHALNVLLVGRLLLLLFGNPWAASLAALLYGLHPLTVEPVAWVAARKTILAATFALGALLARVRHVRGGRRAAGAVSLVLYALAVLAQPTAIALPLVFLLLDVWPLRRGAPRRGTWWREIRWRETWPHLALGAVAAAVTLVSHARSVGLEVSGFDGWSALPGTVASRLAFHAGKILRPRDLSTVYEPAEPGALGWATLVAGVSIVSLLALRRTARAPAVCLAAFVLLLAPTLGLVSYSWVAVADKYAYLPSVALLVGLAGLLDSLWRRGHAARAALTFAVLFLATLEARATRFQLERWRDTVTLHEHMLAVSPRSAALHNNFALHLTALGRHDEALHHRRLAVSLDPGSPLLRTNLANALSDRDLLEEAVAEYEEALRIDPDHRNARFHLGLVLARLDRHAEAAAAFERVLAHAPDFAPALSELASQRFRAGRTAEALRLWRRALTLAPDHAPSRQNLGAALVHERRFAEALPELERALELHETAEARYLAGITLEALGRTDEARCHLERGVELNPEHSGARAALASLKGP